MPGDAEQEWDIKVERATYAYATIRMFAKDKREAQMKAEEQAPVLEFVEDVVEYNVVVIKAKKDAGR